MINNRVKVVLVILLQFVLFFGCAEDNPVASLEQEEEARSSAMVLVRILDAESNEPIKDASVKVYGTESKLTDSDGIVKFSSIQSGTYLISTEKNSYEPIEYRLNLKTVALGANTTLTDNVSKTLYLSKRTARLKGYVYCQVSSTKRQPAAQATVKVMIRPAYQDSATFRTAMRTVTTNAAGMYAVDSLPFGATYSVIAQSYRLLNDEYGSAQAYSPYTPLGISDTTHCETIILQRNSIDNFIMLSSNLDSITIQDSVQLVFTHNLNAASVTAANIVVTATQGSYYNSYATQTMLVGYAVKDNTLKVYPYSGTWTKNKVYTLRISGVESTNGDILLPIEQAFSCHETAAMPDVDILAIGASYSDSGRYDYNTSTVAVFWNQLSTIAEYMVYMRTAQEPNWLSAANSTSESAYVNVPPNSLANGGQVDFMVLGKNGPNQSNPSRAHIISIKDNTGPRFGSPSSTTDVYNTNNSGSEVDAVIKTAYHSFPEPMDTTIIPTVTVTEGGSYYGSGDAAFMISAPLWKWVSPTRAEITLRVPAGKNGSYDTITFNLSKCKDSSGNVAVAEYTDAEPTIAFLTR